MAYAYAAYGGASVFGPMFILGGIGYIIDRFLGTRFFVFAGITAAFIVTNILIYGKTKKLSEMMSKASKAEKEQKEQENQEKRD